jgi:hypothetical protein
VTVREDLEACETILKTMLSVRMADEPAVHACLRLIKRAAAELEDPAVDDTASDDAPAQDAITDQELRERYPGLEEEKGAAMDHVMGVSAVRSEGCNYENGIQTLGVRHVVK